jgi:hypothetical protein
MSSDTQKSLSLSLPEDVRDALAALGNETPPDEREFAARLHRRLAAAGAPPASGWLERLQTRGAEVWQEAVQKRSLVTGAVLGALATATAFLLLSGGRPLRDGTPAASPDDETADVETPGSDPAERGSQRAVGDRHITRDRLGEDIGAERAERPRPHDVAPTHSTR